MMTYLAYISSFFLAMQLINTLINFILRQKLRPETLKGGETISILIPARNEEDNIGHLLSDLRKIKIKGMEVLVFDDQSSDNTAQIIKDFSQKDNRIKLIQSKSLPTGWLGKNHACHQLAQAATGNFYLFIDADVRISGSVIIDALAHMEKFNLGLLSIFPTQIQKTFGEKISVPIMNYILLTLLPLIFVRISPFRSHAAANGQFMLFNARIYKEFQPHMLFKKSAVEDIAISRFLKKQKVKTACLTGEQRISCRMYKSYNESIQGFSKNVFMFFGNVPVLAFIFWFLVSLGFVPVLLANPVHILVYLAGIISTLILYAATSKQHVLLSILLFPFHLIFLLQILVNGVLIKIHQNYSWKGRSIYS